MQNIHNLHAQFAVKRARRLVGKDDFGVVDDGSCDCDALHLSAAELVGAFVDLLVHIDFVKRGNRFRPACFLLFADEAQSKFDVFKHGEVRNKVVTLENETYGRIAIRVPVLVVKFRRGNAAYDQVARRVSVKTAYDVEHCRFSAAARAENRHKFAFAEIERHFSQSVYGRRSGGIVFYYVFKLKHISPQ